MKTIYIHIGCEKTGTTAIQHFLSKNRHELLNQGVSYPEMGLLKTGHFNLAAGIDNWCKNFVGVDYYADKNVQHEKEWNAFLNHCRRTKMPTIVISAEHFSSRLPVKGIEWMRNKLSELGNEYLIKIVVFIRRQDWFIESSYSTAVKSGSTQEFDDFFEANLHARKRYDFYQTLNNWTQFFGKENIIVKDYEAIPSADLIREFCRLVRLEPSSLVDQEVQKNSSWSPAMLAFTKLANSTRIKQILGDDYLPFIKKSNELFGKREKVTLMSQEQRERVLSSYEESNQKVAQLFFPSDDLFSKANSAVDMVVEKDSTITRQDILAIFAKYFVQINNSR